MRKLDLQRLKLKADDVLDNEQFKNVKGGDGPCSIYMNNGSSGYWSSGYSVDAAQFYYGGSWTFSNGYSTTGYCCASC